MALESARGTVNVTMSDPTPPAGPSARGIVNVEINNPTGLVGYRSSERGTVDVTVVSPTAAGNYSQSLRGKTNVTILKRKAVQFWTVQGGVKKPLFTRVGQVTPPPVVPASNSARGKVNVLLGTPPAETRNPKLWPFAQVGPANSPRGADADLVSTTDQRTRALRGGVSVSCAGTNKTIGTAMGINVPAWTVGVNMATSSSPEWTLFDPNVVGKEIKLRIPNPPIRSTETGNGDFLTELMQPDDTSYSIYKFGYHTLDTTNRRASYRSDAWTRVNLRTSVGYADDPTHSQHKRGPRASQMPAGFGLLRRWEAEKAIAGDWQNAIKHTIACAFQGHSFRRGSMNNGVSYIWPAFGADYHGDRANQVLDPPASGNFTLTSTVGGVTRATTQVWNVSVSALQSAIRSWGGDYGAVTVSGSAGSSYTIISVRSNANTFRVSSGATITQPGTTYADVGISVGQYFVFDPNVSVASLNVSNVTKAFAQGFQSYGGYALDMATQAVVYAEVSASDILSPLKAQIASELPEVRKHFIAVANNTETNIHGGGTPVAPLAPAFTI